VITPDRVHAEPLLSLTLAPSPRHAGVLPMSRDKSRPSRRALSDRTGALRACPGRVPAPGRDCRWPTPLRCSRSASDGPGHLGARRARRLAGRLLVTRETSSPRLGARRLRERSHDRALRQGPGSRRDDPVARLDARGRLPRRDPPGNDDKTRHPGGSRRRASRPDGQVSDQLRQRAPFLHR
jgi:hypothetical protein